MTVEIGEVKYKKGYRGKRAVKIDVVMTELERIRQMSDDDMIREEVVVKEARKKRNPLHGFFEWDDRIAGHKYRLEQARGLIRSVIIGPAEDANTGGRFYVHVGSLGGYKSTTDAMSIPDQRAEVLEEARRSMNSFRRKYRYLTELSKVIQAIDNELLDTDVDK